MKKLVLVLLLVTILMLIPTAAFANNGKPPMDRQDDRGWTCEVILGDYHCFNPAFGKSKNTSSISVRVFDEDKEYLGTEHLWRADLYAGQPCPQDHLLTPEDLHMPYYACHRYSH